MKPNFRMLASLAVLSAFVCAPAIGAAQEPPPGAQPPPAGDHPWAERMHQHAEARDKALHDLLNLRPDQEAAFQAMQATMAPPAGRDGMRGQHDMASAAGLTTPERLDRMAARLAQRQAAFQRRAEAIKQFYAVLSPGQQRAFDALAQLRGMAHRGMGGPGRMGGHGHVDGPRGEG
jgi:Spy/CpxP family protein refolding chaperone